MFIIYIDIYMCVWLCNILGVKTRNEEFQCYLFWNCPFHNTSHNIIAKVVKEIGKIIVIHGIFLGEWDATAEISEKTMYQYFANK